MLYTFARLTDAQLAKLQTLEAKIDKKILALTEVSVDADQLTPGELEQLQALEHALGYVLLAVR
jgi:hypothetical protein